MRFSLRIAVPAIALAAALIAPAAASANPTCGQTLTHSVKLTADMDCTATSSSGLIVGKNGITINLNGHAIKGPGGAAGNYYGIYNLDGYDNVTVENGTVQNFKEDVYFDYTTGTKILHVHAINDGADSYYGVDIEYSQFGLIRNVVATGYADTGIYLYENNRVNVTKSHTSGAYYGFYDEESLDKIDHSTASNSYYGLYAYEPSAGSKVLDSKFNGNQDYGIYVYENYPTTLYQDNLTGNVANANGEYGMYATVDAAGSGNRAHGNTTQDCFHVVCNVKHHHKRKHHRHHHKHHH